MYQDKVTLGDCTLYLGDCLEVMKDMPDKSIDAVITDPPYDFSDEVKNIFHKEFTRISKGAIIVFCPPENPWQQKCDQTLFWVKPISTKNTSKSYSRFVEVIQVWNGTTWNAGGHWSQYTNVFTDLVDSKIHPFKKPDSMIIRLLKNHTNKRDIIFDGFFGSGTIPKMCQLNNRVCVACEIDNKLFSDVQQQMRLPL